GTPGALIAAPLGRIRELVTRGVGQAAPNTRAVPAALVKQAHDTETVALVWPLVPKVGATLMAVEGATGARPEPPPHAEMHKAAVVTRATDRVRMRPPE